jgi:hypothetical protein
MTDGGAAPRRDALHLLDELPHDRPFTRSEALLCGVQDRHLAWLVGSGALRRPLVGVYCSERLADVGGA